MPSKKGTTQTPAAIPASAANPSAHISTAASSTYGTSSSSKSQLAPPSKPTKHSSTSTPTTSSGAKNSSTKSTRSLNTTDVQQIAKGVWRNYVDRTPQRVKLIDVFMAWLVVVGALQFVYCVLAGNYPFNAFLSGFAATVGQFVLTASLRIQTNPENRGEFKSISDERAFADYVFGSLLLHFFCVNFIN